jgi:thioredoxin reductase (NADPH)
MYDLIIIGAGPAGLSAAIYATRRAMKTLVLGREVGGQAIYASQVENYPGLDLISGFELMNKMKRQAERLGAEFQSVEVKEIVQNSNPIATSFKVQDKDGRTYESQILLLAFGAVPKKLGIVGEDKFKGCGISYCATCDAPFYKNKIAAVVGGGSAALDAVLLLSKFAKKVYLIHRRDELRAEEVRAKKAKTKKNVELILNSVVREVRGDKTVSEIVVDRSPTPVSNVSDRSRTPATLAVDGIFVEIGHIIESDFVRNLVKLDERGQIMINQKNETNTPGVFAAGDATVVPYKQIIIAAGEGAKAALSAYSYLQKVKS